MLSHRIGLYLFHSTPLTNFIILRFPLIGETIFASDYGILCNKTLNHEGFEPCAMNAPNHGTVQHQGSTKDSVITVHYTLPNNFSKRLMMPLDRFREVLASFISQPGGHQTIRRLA